MKKIGILTSGGDCGGLNAVVKGAAQMGHTLGIKSYIIPNGYAGLYNLEDFDSLVELTTNRVDFVNSNLAGSEAGHSRVKIKKIDNPEKYERIKRGLKKFELDGLVISGGDDSGSVMVDLNEHGIRCIHAPKTMDLDLQSYSVGFDSTVNRIAVFAEDIKTTGRTHNRIIVMDVFGRYAGHTAFRSGIAAEADAVLIPEIPVNFDVVYEHCKERFMHRVRSSDVKAGTYLVIVAEGLRDASGNELVDDTAPLDAFGHKRLAGAGRYVTNQLSARFKGDGDVKDFMKDQKMFVEGLYEVPEVRAVSPGHLVRCGHSSVYDVNFGKEVGGSAVVLLNNGITGKTVVGVNHGVIEYQDTSEVIKQRHVDLATVSFYEKLGICFGRRPVDKELTFREKTGTIERFM
ncbi:MAG: 6-phosphofructokinase [Candidatus Omnitrophica bacterium]|nr:6-phosphofructokinase [Candidatus Omnitrophota bacterium]MCB9721727.1 6-phosphofructokinase [Candidatus Omnitrophota bacterium]